MKYVFTAIVLCTAVALPLTLSSVDSQEGAVLGGRSGSAVVKQDRAPQLKDLGIHAHDYRHGDAKLEGFFVYPPHVDPRQQYPAVMIVHAWRGIDDHVRETARRLAHRGFVAFAADIYGEGIRDLTTEQASQQAGKYRADRNLLRARATAGLIELRLNTLVDPSRIAAIGYCFGGGTVLELARSGADLQGVVSFHGNLDTPDPSVSKNIKGSVLVLHGADDPLVPDDSVQASKEEMRLGKVDWQFVNYGGAVHSFTQRDANHEVAKFDSRASKRSWRAMMGFFTEVLDNP